MAKYADLTEQLPRFINLGGLAEVARELAVPRDEPEEPDDEFGPEWERFSLYHLLEGLGGSVGAVMVADHHWKDYARDYAEGIGNISHVETYVNWGRFADDLRVDYATVEITDGEFVGTWYLRG
ncbi:hypothetical protein [Micromonospora sp. NPDC005652]|uniref:hypothetical protein n=1 Tax=Micromonospora sp. NPDC005652 TaxID=3157046 RepID=UPI0033DDA0CB